MAKDLTGRKDTRKIIINALFKLAQKNPGTLHFTIKDIADEAGISRQAIYQKHYGSVEDIIEDIHTQIATEARERLFSIPVGPDYSPYVAISETLLPVLYTHRDWLKIIYTTSLSAGWFQYITDAYTEWIRPFVKDVSTELKVKEDILIHLTVSQIFSLFIAWLTQPLPLPPEIFKDVFLKLLTVPANEYVDQQFRIN